MKNRKLLLIVSLVLALTMSLGGTLAYLTDTDEAVNVMTLGNVKIEQHEKDAAGNIFEQGQPLYPAYIEGEKITGAIDKVVTVENTGNSDAYVRTWIAFEVGTMAEDRFATVIHKEIAKEGLTLSEGKFTKIEDVNYYVVCATYDDALAAGKTTTPSLMKVYMDPDAKNEDVANFGETYEILVYTQAVQTKNMEHLTPAQALSAGFGDEHPWVDGVNELPTVVVKTAADLKTALEAGGTTVVLGADIDMGTEMVTIAAGKSARLDLAGHDITADHSSKSGESTSLFNVKKGASLTINGDGNVHFAVPTSQKVTATINNESGNVTINGGNYTIDYGTYEQGYLIPAIVDNNTTNGAATLTINGGTFIHDRNMLRNFSNHKSEVAKIVINGGTFLADGDGESFIWNQKPSVNVPAGAGVVEINGGTFVGVKVDDEFTNNQYDPAGDNVNTMAPANTADQLIEALKKGKDVVLTADIEAEAATTAPYGNKYAFKMDGGVIDGNGNELYMECYGDDYGIMTTGGTIKNLTIKEGCRAIMIMYPQEDVILDNVNIGGDGVLYPINTGEAGVSGVDLIVTNSTIKGWTSFGNIESASFTNVKFEQGTYYNNIYGRVFKPYVNTTIKNCSFIKAYNLDLSKLGNGCKVTIENCTVDGQPLTADIMTIPATDAEYDTCTFTVDLPSWATSIEDCVIFK